MRIAMTLTAAMLALAASAHSASAQRAGGGTIGCDPGLPLATTSATQCRLFFKEALYGPAANPYAAPWGYGYEVAPVVRQRTKKACHIARERTAGGGFRRIEVCN